MKAFKTCISFFDCKKIPIPIHIQSDIYYHAPYDRGRCSVATTIVIFSWILAYIFGFFFHFSPCFDVCSSVIMSGEPFVMRVFSLIFVLFLMSHHFVTITAHPVPLNGLTVYTRTELLELRPRVPVPQPDGYEHFPREMKPRKRGKRGGIRNRIRNRKSKPPLPTILLGNVRSICDPASQNQQKVAQVPSFVLWLNNRVIRV